MIIFIIIMCLIILVHGLSKPAGYVRLPVLFAIIYVTWVIPQLDTVLSDGSIPRDAGRQLSVMVALSLGASWIGWYLFPEKGNFYREEVPTQRSSMQRMVVPLVLLTFISVVLNILVSAMSIEMADVSQWTGPITIVSFFASIRWLVLALSLIVFLRRPSLVYGSILIANLVVSIPIAFVNLRRTEMMGLIATIICGLWMGRRIRIPLGVLLASAMGFSVVVYVIGPLRAASNEIMEETGSRPSVFSAELWSHLDVRSDVEQGVKDSPDLENAAYIIAYRSQFGNFGLGAETWNRFIAQYVPGQIVGVDVKRSFYVGDGVGESGDNTGIYDRIQSRFGFNFRTGTTQTGFGSAYSDFGMFGSLYFMALAALMRRAYNTGLAGDVWSQSLYSGQIALSLVSITHHHASLIIVIPLLWTTVWIGRRLEHIRIFRVPVSLASQ